jgi:hypothetical protein
MIRFVLLTAGLLAIVFASAITDEAFPQSVAVGQVWTIKSSSPTSAKVVIGRVETRSEAHIIHVSIIDIPDPSHRADDRRPLQIDHVPFSEAAIAGSVDQLVAIDTSPSPRFENGYDRWRQDLNAGIFDIPVSEAISLFLQAIIRKRT